MNEWLAVFIGGGLGSMARYGISVFFHDSKVMFPISTFTANVIACLLLGAIYGFWTVKTDISPQVRMLVSVGFCGGFSTFSTFSKEGMDLLHSGRGWLFAAYVAASIVAGLLAVWLGWKIGKSL